MKLSEHFDSGEFTCDCGIEHTMDIELINKLEKLFTAIGADAIMITSGYRCPDCSAKIPGGFKTDAHTRGIASDIIVRKGNAYVKSEDVAEIAEKVGFSGIGIIDAHAVHVDVRNAHNYVNSHWFGDERTGNDNIKTFIKNVSRETFSTIITLNGKKYKLTLEEL